jgi:hypothetical protein
VGRRKDRKEPWRVIHKEEHPPADDSIYTLKNKTAV